MPDIADIGQRKSQESVAADAGAGESIALTDVMLAMDVVDTLRH